MRILPWGTMLPVHCCCDPNKRLGWVPAPQTLGPRVFLAGHPTMNLLTGERTEPLRIYTEIEILEERDGRRRLAVKSAHLPIETWRKVPGFLEDCPRDLLTTTHAHV